MTILRAFVLLIMLFPFASVEAIDHPACAGKDNRVCDSMALLIVQKGKGCYRLMNVQNLGEDKWRLTCELASYDRSPITYTLTFTDGRRSYTVR